MPEEHGNEPAMSTVGSRAGTTRRTGFLHQAPDGVWWLTIAGQHSHRIGGWEHLHHLLGSHAVSWQSPGDLRRFREQYGEPPPGIDGPAMTVSLPE